MLLQNLFKPYGKLGITFSCLFVLSACGGGGGDSSGGSGGGTTPPVSYTVSTSAGSGGSLSPASRSVQSGQTTTFTVSANAGYSIASVSGCGGSLSGSTYTTGSITANCTLTATFVLSNQVNWGGLVGSTITAFNISDLSSPIEGPLIASNHTGSLSSFKLNLNGIPDNQLILVRVTDGEVTDFNHDGRPDPSSVVNRGHVFALASARDWRAGAAINPLTDIVWRYTSQWLQSVNENVLQNRMEQLSKLFFKNSIQDSQVTYSDVLFFDPADEAHRSALSFDFQRLQDDNGYLESIVAGSGEDEVNEKLAEIFGANVGFAEEEQLNQNMKILLSVVGRGRLKADSGTLFYDSEDDSANGVFLNYFLKDDRSITLTAQRIFDTSTVIWKGCDLVSDDQSTCKVNLNSDKSIEVTFVDEVVDVVSNFIDLSSAEVTFENDFLNVYVEIDNTELLKILESSPSNIYVAGVSDVGPFLLYSTFIQKIAERKWQMQVREATLDEVIKSGTGFLSRELTYDDLIDSATNANARQLNEPNVRLLPASKDKDSTFRFVLGKEDKNLSFEQTSATTSEADAEIVWDLGGAVARVKGEVDLKIRVDAAASFGITGLRTFRFVPEAVLSNKLDFDISGNFKTPKEKLRKKIYTLHFKPIVFMIGPVPVYFQPVAPVYIGLDGSIETKLTAGVSYSLTQRGGVSYDKRYGWSVVKELSNTFGYSPPLAEGKAGIRGYISTAPAILIYSATGPEIELAGYLRVGASYSLAITDVCQSSLDVGLWGGISGDFDWEIKGQTTKFGAMLGLDKVNLGFKLFELEKRLTGRTIKACNNQPPAMSVLGNHLTRTIVQGEQISLINSYTIKNVGETSMPWSVTSTVKDGRISIVPSSGTLQAGAQTTVLVEVKSSATLPAGKYITALNFTNNYLGRTGQSGLGSTTRQVIIDVTKRQQLVLDVLDSGMGRVVSNPIGIKCVESCQAEFNQNQYVSLTASADEGSNFVGWSGVCSGSAPVCNIIMSQSRYVSARFVPAMRQLKVAKAGSGIGQIISTPLLINCGSSCDATTEYGETVTLSAVAGNNSSFTGWSGDCSGAGSQCTVTMTRSREVTANFSDNGAKERFELTVQNQGLGSGTVISGPAGIDCGSVCNAFFDGGTFVTLTASPMDYSIFDSWSGCDSTDMNQCFVTVNQAKNIIVSFSQNDVGVAPPKNLSALASDSAITLNWETSQGVDSYTLYYSTSPGINVTAPSDNVVEIIDVTTPYSLINLQNGTTYYAVVTANLDNIESMASNEVNATPSEDSDIKPPPIGATAKLNDTGIDWCANDSSNNLVCPVSGYEGQDGEYGRDALARSGQLAKVGGGAAGFDFTKLDASGNALPETASEWSCVRDNHTGLMWEVKTDDGGLRDKDNTYSWYNPDNNTNGGSAGTQNGGSCAGSDCDTYAFVQAVNSQGLCGINDWRMPTRLELMSIVHNGVVYPSIDTAYFPNTLSRWFWSSTPNSNSSDGVWQVSFEHGSVGGNISKRHWGGNKVRLVGVAK